MRVIGSHTCDNGGIHMAVVRAAAAGLRTLQLFTAIPKFYGDRSRINPDRVQRFRAALAETDIRAEHVVVHAAYVLNTATTNADQWARAAGGLAMEMERSTALGIGSVCFHPGSAGSADPKDAVRRVAEAMTRALEAAPDSTTRLLVENTAGAGRTVGRTPEEVAGILSHIPAELRPRTGYGLDTCHLYASGFDIAESEARLRAVLDEFESATGEPPSFFHLNDSEGDLGSNRDRHVLLGEGRIGAEPFRWLLRDPRTAAVPLILETPQQNEDIGRDDPSPDPYDIRMLALLRGFEVEPGPS
ncbi:MAG: deoxyribonuclease IV [Longimicrobiales bacterium]